MSRNIAIKGNREPKKIIKTLEMLGGINELKLYGTDEHNIYYINQLPLPKGRGLLNEQ